MTDRAKRESGEELAPTSIEDEREALMDHLNGMMDSLYEARGNFIAESSQAYDDVDPDEAAAFVEAARKAEGITDEMVNAANGAYWSAFSEYGSHDAGMRAALKAALRVQGQSA